MAYQKWSTKGYKDSDETKSFKKNYLDSNQNYNNFVNQGVQTSPQTTNFYNQLQDLQKNNKLSNTFKYSNQAGYNKALNDLTNREAFKYDLSNDTLYNQAKDQYQVMGKQAMADTIGQASAMTGGYGNSYATTAGSQAYQGYLQQLNNNIADYYNMALGAYNSETDRLQGNFNAFATDRGQQQNEWVGNWDVYNSRFNNLSNAWANSRDYDLNSYNTQANQLGNVNTQNFNAFTDSRNQDIDLWKTNNSNLLDLYNLRDTWEQNQIENNQNQQKINLDRESFAETGRHNKVTEKQTDIANNIDLMSATKSGDGSIKQSDISNAQKAVKGLGKNYKAIYNYIDNLPESYDGYIETILASVGLTPSSLQNKVKNSNSKKQTPLPTYGVTLSNLFK